MRQNLQNCHRFLDRSMKMKTKLIVLTGGPGAGKTAVLELIKKQTCPHVAILPEAASILFGGGFWRLPSKSARMAAQRSIFYIQTQMEFLVQAEKKWEVGLCDRGTIDALAYWPEDEKSFWKKLGTSKAKEYSKYAAIVHLRTPSEKFGYNYQNPIRIESPKQAAALDAIIEKIWKNHPHYFPIESQTDFLKKAHQAIEILTAYLPNCCKKKGPLYL